MVDEEILIRDIKPHSFLEVKDDENIHYGRVVKILSYHTDPSRWTISLLNAGGEKSVDYLDIQDIKLIEEENITEYLRVQESKLIAGVMDYVNILKETYPDNSAVQITNGGSAVDFYINFEHIEIENSDGNNHQIYDLVFKMRVNCRTRTVSSLNATRMSLTPEEIESDYGHSHIDDCIRYFSNDICMSDTDIATTRNLLAVEYNVDQFQLFLFMLENFAKWESLEGGPYRKIRNISLNSGNEVVVKESDVDMITEYILREKSLSLECCSDDKKSVYIPADSIRELLEGCLIGLIPKEHIGKYIDGLLVY